MKKVILAIVLTVSVCFSGTMILNHQRLTDSEMMKVVGGCRDCTDCADHTCVCADYPNYEDCPNDCNHQNKYWVGNLCREGSGPLTGECDPSEDQVCWYYHDCYCHQSGQDWECAANIDSDDYSYDHSDDPC